MNKEIIKRTLTIQSFHVTEVVWGEGFELIPCMNEGGKLLSPAEYTLAIPEDYLPIFCEDELISTITLRIIPPDKHHVHINSVMDIFPISTKVLGRLGEGTSRTITGVCGMITGADENGVSVCAFGSSDGMLDEKVALGMAGTPSPEDYILCFDVILKAGAGFSRSGPDAAHRCVDSFCQNIRKLLKKKRGQDATEVHVYHDIVRPNAKRVVIVKLVSGQGAMYDTHYLPAEPSGFENSRSIIDAVSVPVILSPNEYRDGAIRALY